MKWIKRIFFGFVIVILLAILGLYLTGNKHVLKGVCNTYLKGRVGPSIDEHEIFYNRPIQKGNAQEWEFSDAFKELSEEQNAYHEKFESVAFVVVDQGKIVSEKYWEGHSEETISNSFSMSKSIVSILVGIAIDQGKINDLNEKASMYIPELNGNR